MNLRFVSVLVLLGALGCNDGSNRRASIDAAALAIAHDDVPLIASPGEGTVDSEDPAEVVGWGELRRRTLADGRVVAEVAAEDGEVYRLANAAVTAELADGAEVRFAGALRPNHDDGDGSRALLATSLVAGAPRRAVRPLVPAPADGALLATPAALPATLLLSATAATAAPTAGAPGAAPAAAGAAPALELPPPWASRHGMSAAEYQQQAEALRDKGFRPVAVHAAGDVDEASFTAIWIKDGKPNAAIHGRSSDGYAAVWQDLVVGEGYRPVSVSAYGSYPHERYVATFVKDGRAFAARRRMDEDAYRSWSQTYAAQGLRKTWVSVIGWGATKRFAAVWVKDGKASRSRWDLSDDEFAAARDALAKDGYRLVSCDDYGTSLARRWAGVWVRDAREGAANNLTFVGQTSAQYQLTSEHLAQAGFHPTCALRVGGRYTSSWEEDRGDVLIRARGSALPAHLAGVDAAIRAYMEDRKVRNVSVALLRGEQVVFDRTYTRGPLSAEARPASTRYRLASVSKPLTSVGVLRLVDQGKVDLDARLDTYLTELKLPLGRLDPRFGAVTIRQLLQHRGGWARSAIREGYASGGEVLVQSQGFDPMYHDLTIRWAYGGKLPLDSEDYIRWMARWKRLAFQPGQYYCYSNLGYNILGRVIERVTGRSYEAYMRDEVFARAGAYDFRVGRTELHRRLSREPIYFDPSNRIVLDRGGSGERTPRQYGGFNMPARDANGGWVGSARDLVKVCRALNAGKLLAPSTITEMWTRPADPNTSSGFHSYALGWSVSASGLASHNGSYTGTRTYLAYRPGGVVYAALTNQNDGGPEWSSRGKSLARRLNDALAAVVWP